jgi:WD40 repeat protein
MVTAIPFNGGGVQSALSPDGRLLAGGDARGRVAIHDAASGKELRLLEGVNVQVLALAFTADGKRLAAATPRGITVWDAATGEPAGSTDKLTGARRLRFHPDSRRLAALVGSRVRLWDPAADTVNELPSTAAEQLDDLAFGPRGTQLAVGGREDSLIWILDVENGRVMCELDVR